MHSEGYRLFVSFWWLIFPIGWGFAGMMRAFLSHKRAQQALDVIKAYADQGKEIPPELLDVLRRPDKRARTPQERARTLMIGGLMNAALALAFATLTIGEYLTEGSKDTYGLVFVVVLFTGFSAALLISSTIIRRERQDSP
jgi:hypothetical protein